MAIDFDKGQGLVPAIIQDAETRKVLMLGYMNEEAYRHTLETGEVTFWSRSRKKLWTKGETSGNTLQLVDIKADCDQDTLLIQVHPNGPVCHLGTDTCWGESNTDKNQDFLDELQRLIYQRKEDMPAESYTTSLFMRGVEHISQKVGEEAIETVIASLGTDNNKLIDEASDLLYHLLVLLAQKGLSIDDIRKNLCRRHAPSWDARRRIAKYTKTKENK